ncbi:MAG: glycosyltransferase [Flavobacterium lindanitolerans]|uniref:glycosyltransferase n=1 Tax=Flavobacterium lindanitolerans TaxID=428988 RepID=UPI001A4DA6DC|nr:glycosyltransferase [Flavobacterium lindanitolerans]MBL7868300.1 glycosyltransferase [Flavobacterium lindanitolerans]
MSSKKILVAPLNWGLGHATRCIPIIEALENNGYTPIIASDGVALQMLQKEFPHLQSLELPSYHIEYAKNGAFFKWKMIKNSPKMIEAILQEKKTIRQWIDEYDIAGIISDNRLGVYSKKIPSVFITHQLNVLTGNTTWISSKVHQHIIKKFNQCWIPDVETKPNLSGKLGHLENPEENIKYIGPLSRLHRKPTDKKYDLMVILSGPEPQRGMLEAQLTQEMGQFKGKVVFIKGKIEPEQKIEQVGNVTYYNFMNTEELENTFNESEIVLCRSGYTTIMDLAQLGKKAFFIPTPGQYEQEYLAKKLKKEGLVPFARQEDFKIENLMEIDLFKGLKNFGTAITWNKLFCLFEGK